MLGQCQKRLQIVQLVDDREPGRTRTFEYGLIGKLDLQELMSEISDKSAMLMEAPSEIHLAAWLPILSLLFTAIFENGQHSMEIDVRSRSEVREVIIKQSLSLRVVPIAIPVFEFAKDLLAIMPRVCESGRKLCGGGCRSAATRVAPGKEEVVEAKPKLWRELLRDAVPRDWWSGGPWVGTCFR